MRSLAVFAFLLALSCAVAYGDEKPKSNRSRSLDCVNFYWRSYGKIIPVDAVVGGHDEQGKEIYVGRGAIKNSKGQQVTPLGINTTAPLQEASNVEILCANPLSEVRWVKVSGKNIQNLLTEEYPIVAGVDFNSPLYQQKNIYVGRIENEGELLVGKVIIYEHNNINKAAIYFFSHDTLITDLEDDIEILVANV